MPLDVVLRRFAWKVVPARTNNEREFLPAALEIIETPPSPAGRMILFTIVSAAVIALAWACIGKIDIIATAPGRIVPVGKTKTIQPMEIGIVTAIRVADGDVVHKGQVLIELDPTQATADHDRYARELAQARLDLMRYQALWSALKNGQPPVLPAEISGIAPDDIEAARAAMNSQQDQEAASLADLDQQIAEKNAEAAATKNSIAKYEASLPYVQQQAELREQLMKIQFGNKLSYLQAEQALVEQQRQIVVLRDELAQAVAQKKALDQKRAETADTYETTLLDDLNKARTQVNELDAGFIKARDTMEFKTLKAPIDGTVQELSVHTVGGVVTPAQPLMTIVPSKAGLVVEAMVNNRDVGFVQQGQKAKVKIDAFNFTQYGLIDGKVVGLSHDAIQQPPKDGAAKPGESQNGATPGEPSYVARIALDRSWIETENGRSILGPGMSATVEIHTGERRVIDYLLSPLARKASESMHER